jgi:hypothetical protein
MSLHQANVHKINKHYAFEHTHYLHYIGLVTGVSGVGIVERALPSPTVNAQVSKQQTLEPDLDPISRLAKVLSSRAPTPGESQS